MLLRTLSIQNRLGVPRNSAQCSQNARQAARLSASVERLVADAQGAERNAGGVQQPEDVVVRREQAGRWGR